MCTCILQWIAGTRCLTVDCLPRALRLYTQHAAVRYSHAFGSSLYTQVLGVCLGHQGLATAFGGVVNRGAPRHGHISRVSHKGVGIFAGVPSPIDATRYHSLYVDEDSLPDCLAVTARADDDGAVMGLEHTSLPMYGVQFHPESVRSCHLPSSSALVLLTTPRLQWACIAGMLEWRRRSCRQLCQGRAPPYGP